MAGFLLQVKDLLHPKQFAEGYKGVTMEINVKDGTTKLLEEIGVRGQGEDLRALRLYSI